MIEQAIIEEWRRLLDEWHEHLDEEPLGLGDALSAIESTIAHLRPTYGRCPDGPQCQHGCPDALADYWEN